MGSVQRIVLRYLHARKYTRPKNMEPVYNTDKERIVYVLPETIQEESGKYKKIPPSKLNTEGKPAPRRHPGQPHLPKRPKKPHKSEIPRDPPPSPVHPPLPPKPHLPPKKPKVVPILKPPKVPEPSKPQDFKRKQRFMYADENALLRIVERHLGGE